ncbi:MAG TPA: DNA helicase Rep [Gammaproteobacteria bacterium]|nr:DNA helicase Rep [Gammaproteobacteria bacterium]
MNLLQLNQWQRAAVKYIDSPLLVLAGAGSGKTRVITQKIAYLIKACDLKASNIAAVTFTNKAAKEMKERVGQILEKSESRGLKVSTFHTLGLNILKKEHKLVDLRPGFSIFDSHDVASLIKEIVYAEVTDDSDQVQQLQWKISHWKNALVSPEKAKSLAEDKLDVVCANVYERYQKSLLAYNAIDFDDLIYLPVILFQHNPAVLAAWQSKIRYLLVDEYQDTNGSQYELVKLIVGGRNCLTVVGDDDQSVYSWRGAQPENLVHLKTDYPDLEVIKLEQNYRSMGRILKAANQLISNNPHVYEKKLWSDKGFGDPIRILKCKNDEHEAERIASEILSHRFQNKTNLSDYAILYRGNHQSRVIEKALREQRIPYHISGGSSFFEKPEVKDIMAYLRLMSNPDDDAAFLRIINTPRREIGASTLQKLGTYAQSRSCSLFRACSEVGLQQAMSARAHENLHRFSEWLSQKTDQLDREKLSFVIRNLVNEIDYETYLVDSSKNPNAAEKRMENVNELLAWIERLSAELEEEKSISEVVNYMMLMNILERQDDDDNTLDCVNLSTLHAAKGLEYPHVFIIGMEEDILPHRASLDEGNVEEERRLAYVGITRAQKNLTMSYSRIRKRYGERTETEYSRFIDELPEDDLQWQGGKSDASPEEQKQRGNAHLANLRDMLGGS